MARELYSVGNYMVSVDRVTADSGKNFPVQDLDYVNHFAVKQDTPSEAVITFTDTEGLTTSEEIRFGISDVKNVYQNSLSQRNLSSNPSIMASGKQILVERKGLYTFSSTNDSTSSAVMGDIPVTVRVVVKVPTHSLVTSILIKDAIERCVGALLNTGGTDMTRLSDIVKGSLIPTGM